MDYENNTIKIIAVRNIEQGEELFINYNGDWDDPQLVWFDAI
jgi:SET domain-containing protein